MFPPLIYLFLVAVLHTPATFVKVQGGVNFNKL